MSKVLKFYSLALIYFLINLNHLESTSLPNDDAPTSSDAKVVNKTPVQDLGHKIPNMRMRRPSKEVDLSTLLESEQEMLQWTEAWSGHNRVLHLVYWNTRDHVAIYFDYNVGPPYAWKTFDTPYRFSLYGQKNARWLFTFTSSVWYYMTRTYGQLGKDPYLYLVIHPDNYEGAHRFYSLNPENNSATRNRNILDLSSIRQKSNRKFAWYGTSQTHRNMEMDLIVNQLAFFVEESSKGRFGSPSLNVWRNESSEYTAWTDIFTYDVYMTLSMADQALRYRTSAIQKMETRGNIMWFNNWFLPIYEDHGGSSVLNGYFTLLRDNVRHVGVMYKYTLNTGEFIHFWSGAAKTDLKLLATKAFGWNSTYQTQFLKARGEFPNVTALYNVTDLADIVTPAPRRKSKTMKTAKETLASSTKGDNVKPVPTTTWRNSSIIETIDEAISNSTTTHSTTPIPTTRSTRKFAAKSSANTTTDSLTKTAIVIIGGSVGSLIIITLILAFIAFCIFHKRKIHTLQTEIRALTNDEVKDFFNGDGQIKKDEAHALVFSTPFIKDFEISRDRMTLDQNRVLGEGQFGTVVHGFIKERENNQLVPAAVKTVKPSVDVICFKTFLSEVKIMAYLGIHENIVKLLGTCTSNIKNREIFIALEFCSLGNMEEFLKKNRHNFDKVQNESPISGTLSVNDLPEAKIPLTTVTQSDLFKWSQEISNAMLYLTQKKVIHGDLAARNVLLTENRVVKISDFGLSRQFLNYANYMKTSKLPVPWRWLSIEALNELKFSTASDVWAFGVTLWEIFSLAEIPYGAWTYDLFFVDRLLAGDRLLKPIYANQDLYKLMNECWMIDPAHRPTFQHIYNRLGELITSQVASNGGSAFRNEVKKK